jgi:hypothetical protein
MEQPTFNLSVEFDDKPLKNPHLRRLSLIFKGAGKEELVIRGFLLPQDHKELLPPSTIVSGQRYSIATLSPMLQERILNSFCFEDLYPVRAAAQGDVR